MTEKEIGSYQFNLKNIHEIAYEKVEGIEEHDSYLVELFLKTLYYYSKLENKAINITSDVQGFYKIISTLMNTVLDRNTDLLDALFVIFKLNACEDKYFEETYTLLYNELNGRKRLFNEELETVIRNAGAKFSKYCMNLVGLYTII